MYLNNITFLDSGMKFSLIACRAYYRRTLTCGLKMLEMLEKQEL